MIFLGDGSPVTFNKDIGKIGTGNPFSTIDYTEIYGKCSALIYTKFISTVRLNPRI